MIDLIPELASHTAQAYTKMTNYLHVVEQSILLADQRLRFREFGSTFMPISKNKLFSNSSGFIVNEKGLFPFDIWLPAWLGRFYVPEHLIPDGIDPDKYPAAGIRFTFLWFWVGANDAYLVDKGAPEIWVGKINPNPKNPKLTCFETAQMIWRFIRVEKQGEKVDGDWVYGKFSENEIGCELVGDWKVKRMRLGDIKTMYDFQKEVIEPIVMNDSAAPIVNSLFRIAT